MDPFGMKTPRRSIIPPAATQMHSLRMFSNISWRPEAITGSGLPATYSARSARVTCLFSTFWPMPEFHEA
jgi:hypothetical protein